ncbi:MAG: T9SS type A sorting domain-containing protein [Chitinophagaceae bacterium]|nr:T9SS type A sorting domain-containing protein [Chitinophagaceae bacterium]
MKKIIFFLSILFACANVFAQENHPCAIQKQKSFLNKKKSRAGAYDNDLMNRYDVHFYFLDLNIERTSTVISGATTMGVKFTQTTDTFAFELNNSMTIDSIELGNTNMNFVKNNNMVYVISATPIVATSNLFIKIYYNGDASVIGGSAIGNGFSTGTSTSWGNNVTWSLSEPYSAYEWFPCKQFLQDKADSVWVFVTTSNQNKVGSNGLLEGIDNLPNNKVRYRWKSNYPIAYYLISVAVARYVEYTNYAHPASLPNDSIPIVNYVYNNPATLPAFQDQLDSIPMMIEFFSDIAGLYPFYKEKYGNAMAPFGGGMEHQTMTSVGNLGNFGLNAHELFHHWHGDHVTCSTWGDISINEGFASYSEYLANEHFRGLAYAQNKMLDVHWDITQQPDGSVFCPDTTDVGRIFSGRWTYNKGSAVLHTLRFILGDTMFFNTLKNFQTQFSMSNASFQDLKTVAQNTSGQNLNNYFNEWIYGEGFPIYSVSYYSNGNAIFLKVAHNGSMASNNLYTTPLELKLNSPSGDTIVKLNITSNVDSFMIASEKIITNVAIDPNNWIVNQDGQIKQDSSLVLLSLKNVSNNDVFKLFPNPNNGKFKIIMLENVFGKMDIYDMQGKLVDSKNIHPFENIIDISKLSNGNYKLILDTDNGFFTTTIQKIN